MRQRCDHIFEFTPEALREWVAARGWPRFRAAQVLDWVYGKGIVDAALMTNLRPGEREVLAREMVFLSGRTVAEQAASDGTRKLLIEWGEGAEGPRDRGTAGPSAPGAMQRGEEVGTGGTPIPPRRVGDVLDALRDGEREASESLAAAAGSLPVIQGSNGSLRALQTECVMIPADYDEDLDDGQGDFARKTACISSQVGCPVGCAFCASGVGGLEGNLSAGRIVEQVWRLARLPGVERITNVVFMGMGEPLANLSNVVRAVRTLAAPWGLGISARKITISTVGLPRAIERLAEELELPVTLALSLHAPNDGLRRELIPWAEYTTIEALFGACAKWFEKTGREITLEYTLLGGVNDRREHAEELARVAKRLRANVNIIRYNEVKGMPFQRPATEDVRRFQEVLRGARVNAHIRASRGRDIAAACGQLRREGG